MEFVTLIVPVLTVCAGLGALVFAALRFNREDASSVVSQQSTLLSDMRAMLDEKQEELDRAKQERSRLHELLHEVSGHCADLETEIMELRKRIRQEESNGGA